MIKFYHLWLYRILIFIQRFNKDVKGFSKITING